MIRPPYTHGPFHGFHAARPRFFCVESGAWDLGWMVPMESEWEWKLWMSISRSRLENVGMGWSGVSLLCSKGLEHPLLCQTLASGAPCQLSRASKRSGHNSARPKAAMVHDVDGLGDRLATELENVLDSCSVSPPFKILNWHELTIPDPYLWRWKTRFSLFGTPKCGIISWFGSLVTSYGL